MRDKNVDISGGAKFSDTSRPLTALVACARFIRNVNDTEQFFRVIDAVDGRRNEQNFQRFLRMPAGAKLDAEGVDFSAILSDRKRLAACPEGSLGRAYVRFLETEDLSLDLLMQAERDADASTVKLDASRRRFMAGGIAIHDVLHVVTGYGREPLGEACLVAFTAEQLKLAGMGAASRALALREQLKNPGAPVLAAFREARARSKALSVWYPLIDWRDYFSVPLAEVRRALRLEAPAAYQCANAVAASSPPPSLPEAA